jgi:hypothetical protein
MLHGLACTCDAVDCDRSLDDDDDLALTMVTAAGERRAYECECGEVTVTVVRPGE